MKLSTIFNGFALLLLATLTACIGNPKEVISAGDATGEVTMSASRTLIEADGKDVAFFTVMQGGMDVTKSATIYQKVNGKWAVYDDVKFSTNKVGVYEFSADHNNESSSSISIQAATGISELPEDPEPDRFDGFRKRVMAMQFTGTGCGYCPYVIKAIEEFLPMENAKNMIFTALHSYNTKDPMYSDDAWDIANNLGVSGYPTVVYNMDITSNANNTTAESISDIVDSYMAIPARSAISASVTMEGSEENGTITVQGAIKVGVDGEYKINAWLLEDGIIADQTSYVPNIQIGNVHNNAVRLCGSTTPAGKKLGGKGRWNAGEIGSYLFDFNLAEAGIEQLKNCHVVVYVTSDSNGGYFTVDNVIDLKIGEVRTFEYND